MFYLATWDDEGNEVLSPQPFGYGFALTQMEHDKGGNYPSNVSTVIFDEFMTRSMYLPDEMALFSNVLSTLLRDDGNAKIWLLGNTVSWYCPYFREMGLRHIKNMEIGGVQVYTGNWLSGCPEGKNGHTYQDYSGVAIECQNYPDAPNKEDYPSAVLRPGEVYEQAIIFAFGIRK
jgi:hypothetical protein